MISVVRFTKNAIPGTRLKYWLLLTGNLIIGQGLLQLLNLLTGFFLLRWLSVDAYAQYSVAFGFQSTFNILVDLGFAGSIVALVGERTNDKQLIGTYIRSAQFFRNRLFIVMAPVAALTFPLVARQHGWHWQVQLFLVVSILFSLFFEGQISYYSAPLLIQRKVRNLYLPKVVSAAGRLILCYLLHLFILLSSWPVAWLNWVGTALVGMFYRTAAKPYVLVSPTIEPTTNREMIQYLAPLIPAIVFTALQGQISVFIISIFGSTQNIAEVAALGRVGQLFSILNTINSVIVAPYIAQLERQYLVKRYFQIVTGATVLSLLLIATTFWLPQPLLWFLGPNYQHLKLEIGWMVVVACINYTSGVMWTIQSARKWIYWWGSILYISLLLLAQVICVTVMDLGTTINVIYFSLVISLVVLLVHTTGAVYGFRYGARVSDVNFTRKKNT